MLAASPELTDENLHAEAGAWLYRTLCEEQGFATSEMESTLREAARAIREHEHAIIENIFSAGKIDGITDTQMKHFIDSRINLCLRNLGLTNQYNVTYNPIADYFYKGINSVVLHDFFYKTGASYNRAWDERRFVW
jgi:ribonucleotide reductase beta subunit family protein with ferritin-like domain